MAQTNFTPILLYASGTPTNVPSAGNLTSSASGAELALNYADGKLFYKDSGGNVQTLASKATGSIGGSDTQIQYNSSGALAGSANLTFNGTTLTANALTVSTGNLAFTGTAQRITGDMSNATQANRLAFQSSTVNGNTALHVLPNGTSTIGSYLAFNNSDPTNAAFIQIQANGSTEARLVSSVTGTGTYLPMTFYTGGSERVRVDTSGNVGIGTTSPSSYGRLGVMTPTANNGFFGIANSAGGAGGVQMAQYYGTVKISYIDTTLTNGTLGSETAYLAFATADSGTLGERMRIDSSGNVGIGTTSPGDRLDVVGGNIRIASGNTVRWVDAGNIRASIQGDSSSNAIFSTAGSERLRIDSSGNVGIGTAPSYTFDVYRSGTNTSVIVARNDNSVAQFYSTSSSSFAGTSTNTPFGFITNNTERMRFLAGGGITSEDRADAVGYKGTPLNEQSANYTLVIGDMGKSITHPASDNNPRTFTIPANGSVAYPVGTTITFINMINTLTIAITTDTMYLAGAGTTGSRTLAAYGMATAVKMTSTTWIISGNNLT